MTRSIKPVIIPDTTRAVVLIFALHGEDVEVERSPVLAWAVEVERDTDSWEYTAVPISHLPYEYATVWCLEWSEPGHGTHWNFPLSEDCTTYADALAHAILLVHDEQQRVRLSGDRVQ